jgi:ParB family chromosome partitioning protein
MLDFGWSEQQIADARRLKVEQVRTAVRARALPAPARHALNQGTLTEDQVRALDEFEDSPEERQKLLDELGDQWRFKQALARLREKRAYAKNKELARAHLVLGGVDVTPKPRGFRYEGTATPADQLLDGDGNPVDVETVKTLPGFHGFVEKDGPDARTVVYCDDPAERGYTRKPTTSPAHQGMSQEEIAAKEERDRQEAERIERLKLAATVRREFLVATYGTARTAKPLFVAALRTATLGKSLGRSADLNDLYQALGGSDPETLTGAGEDRLRRSLVAKYICNQEYNLSALWQTHGSRYGYWLSESEAIAWYDELRDRNYPLTDDEHALYQELSAAEKDDEQDDDLDEELDDERIEDQQIVDEVTADADEIDGTDDDPNATIVGLDIQAGDDLDDLEQDDEFPLAA